MSIEQDYIDLFSLAKKGHMSKYMYMHDPEELYERILQNDNYYPFKMERDLINQMSDKVCEYFQDVRHVLELGPGSQTPVMTKTIPFLKSLLSKVENFTYTAIDSNLKYTEQCRYLIKKAFNNLNVQCLEIDFLKKNCLKEIKEKFQLHDKKLIISFGQCIFYNHSNSEIKTLIRNISSFLNKNDYLLFGLDENQDPFLLEKAYNTDLGHRLLLNTMYFLKYKFNLENFKPEGFRQIYEWNSEEKTVKLSLKSTIKQKINLKGQEILINNDQEFHILNSQRPSLEEIKKFLSRENIIIKDKIHSPVDQNNKFSLLVAQKR